MSAETHQAEEAANEVAVLAPAAAATTDEEQVDAAEAAALDEAAGGDEMEMDVNSPSPSLYDDLAPPPTPGKSLDQEIESTISEISKCNDQ